MLEIGIMFFFPHDIKCLKKIVESSCGFQYSTLHNLIKLTERSLFNKTYMKCYSSLSNNRREMRFVPYHSS